MECFEELKDSIGELFSNSQKSCCESNQIFCESQPSNLSGGAIAGIVIGSIIGVALVAALLVFFFLNNNSFRNQSKANNQSNKLSN